MLPRLLTRQFNCVTSSSYPQILARKFTFRGQIAGFQKCGPRMIISTASQLSQKNTSSCKTAFFSTSSKSNSTKETDSLQLSIPERVRALVQSRKSGTLTTHSSKDNLPPLFGSIMPYVLLENSSGCPVFGLREEEQHFKHVQKFAKGSFVVFPLTPVEIPPGEVPVPRVNFTGDIEEISEDQQIIAQEEFINRHPAAKDILSATNYRFFRFVPTAIYFLGGKEFGKTEIVSVNEFKNAKVDPVASGAVEIINTMNTKYMESLYLFCQKYSNINVKRSTVFMFSVDRLGFNLMAKDENAQWVEIRLPFPYEMKDPRDCMGALEESINQLRQQK